MDEFWRHGIHWVREQVKTNPPTTPATGTGGVVKPCAAAGTPTAPTSPGQTGQGGCVDPDG
jgi:hypothetical protein